MNALGRHNIYFERFNGVLDDEKAESAMKTRCWLAIVLSALLTLVVHANEIEDARLAFEAGDYEKALSILTIAAENGNDRARFRLGVMYLNGEGVDQDYGKAAHWFEKTYEHPWSFMRSQGQVAMAILHHNGLGVPRDYVKACYLFEEAANIGNPFDVYKFEKRPISDLDVRPNLAKSLAWFREAASEDEAGAQFCLFILGHPVSVAHRLFSRRDAVEDEVIHLALFLGLHVVVGSKRTVGPIATRYFAGVFRDNVRGIETCDRARA